VKDISGCNKPISPIDIVCKCGTAVADRLDANALDEPCDRE
jgi:hypothetical protein